MLVTCRQAGGPNGIWATVGCIHNLVACGSHVLVQVLEYYSQCMLPRKLVGPKLPVVPTAGSKTRRQLRAKLLNLVWQTFPP